MKETNIPTEALDQIEPEVLSRTERPLEGSQVPLDDRLARPERHQPRLANPPVTGSAPSYFSVEHPERTFVGGTQPPSDYSWLREWIRAPHNPELQHFGLEAQQTIPDAGQSQVHFPEPNAEPYAQRGTYDLARYAVGGTRGRRAGHERDTGLLSAGRGRDLGDDL